MSGLLSEPKMGCKTESINALKRKKEEEDKGKKNKIF
jgi:hypothetical protein